jgi:hypothetical protein
LSNRHFKQLSREIAAAQPNVNSHRLKWSTNKIDFDEEDHPISTKAMGTIPLLCMPTINNIAVNRTLIDGGAGLNIILYLRMLAGEYNHKCVFILVRVVC